MNELIHIALWVRRQQFHGPIGQQLEQIVIKSRDGHNMQIDKPNAKQVGRGSHAK